MNQRRIMSSLLIFVFMIMSIASGCQKGTTSIVVQAQKTISASLFMNDTEIRNCLTESVGEALQSECSIAGMVFGEDQITILWSGEDVSYFSQINIQTQDTETIMFPCQGRAVFFDSDTNGGYYLVQEYQDELWHTQYLFGRLDMQGEWINEPTTNPDFVDQSILSADMGPKGQLCVVTSTSVLVLDGNFSTQSKITSTDTLFSDAAFTADGTLCVLQNSNLPDDGQRLTLAELSDDYESVKSETDLSDGVTGGYGSIFGASSGIDDGIMAICDNKICIYHINENEVEYYCSRTAGEMGVESTSMLTRISDEEYWMYCDYYFSPGNDQEGIYQLAIKEPSTDKKTLTIGVISLDDYPDLVSMTDYFNAYNNKYNISIIEYANTDETATNEEYFAAIEAGRKQLVNSLLTDSCPDVLCLSAADQNDLILQSDILDLGPLIDGSNTLSEDDLIPNIWDACSVNDTHYWVAPFYSIEGMAVQTQYSDELNDYSYLQMKTLSEATKRAMAGKADDIESIFYPYMQDRFLQYDMEQDSMDTEDCISWLEDMKNYQLEISENTPDFSEPLMCHASLGSFSDYITVSSYFTSDITLIGFPGISEEGTYIGADECFSIPVQSSSREGAWAFIELLLSNTVQSQNNSLRSGKIPLLESAFETAIESDTDKYISLQSSGTLETHSIKISTGEDMSYATYPVDVDEAMQERYRKIIYNSDKLYVICDEIVQSILSEEIAPFLLGDKSVDETASLINSRIGLYISEKQ